MQGTWYPGAEAGLQTFAAEVPGIVLRLVAKAAQDQNTGRWPWSSHFTAYLKTSAGDSLDSWEFQEGKTEVSHHLGLHWLFRGRRAAPRPVQGCKDHCSLVFLSGSDKQLWTLVERSASQWQNEAISGH